MSKHFRFDKKSSKIGVVLLFMFSFFGSLLLFNFDTYALKYPYSSLLLTPYADYYEDTTHDATSHPWYPYTSVFNYYEGASFSISGSGGVIPYDRYGIWYPADSVGLTEDDLPNFHAPRVDLFPDSSCITSGNQWYSSQAGSAVGFVSMFSSANAIAYTDSALNFLDSTAFPYSCYKFGQQSWIEYSSLYMHSTYSQSVNTVSSGNIIISSSQDSDTTITNNWYLKFSELSGYSSGRFYGMILPLTYNSANIGSIDHGTTLTFETEFEFSSPITLNTNEQRAFLYIRGLGENNVPNFSRRDCGMVYRTVEAIDAYHLITTCTFDSPVNLKAADFVVAWIPNGDPEPYNDSSITNDPVSSTGIFDFSGDFKISQYLITDGDDTYCSGDNCNISYTPFGYSLNEAPGNASDRTDIPSGDSSFDLSSLFSFMFVNPFAPLFQMFADNNSCASIPTLASMLHSQETTVCPWFDSTTRNIVTPVLGIASMMLIFGFAVRWLSSSSGNFFDDSGGVESGGFHFENKFRRKR